MRRQRTFVIALAAALIAAISMGCNGGGSPTAPDGSTLVLTHATVSVGGKVLNGQTLPRGHGEGATARFEAVLEKDGVRMAGGTVRVRHLVPGGMMMMGSQEFHLFDDGTHGDHTPGDGLYCFEDDRNEHGCHTGDAPRGSHHYDFMGTHGSGHKSDLTRVTVTIE